MDVVGVMAAYLPYTHAPRVDSVSVDMDVVGVMAAYLPVVRVCSTHTHYTQICCYNTDYVHINGHDRTITVILAKHCIELPDDGSLEIRNMFEQF